jgi:hypothetical protein
VSLLPVAMGTVGLGKRRSEWACTLRRRVLARFIPVVRSVLNPLAGVLAVPAHTFRPSPPC